MFSNYHQEQKQQRKEAFGNNFSNRNLFKEGGNAKSNAGQAIAGLNNGLLIGGQPIQVQPKAKPVRGPNPLLPSSKQAPLYDPSHRFQPAIHQVKERKSSQVPPQRAMGSLNPTNSRADRYTNGSFQNAARPGQYSRQGSTQRAMQKTANSNMHARHPHPADMLDGDKSLALGIGGSAIRAVSKHEAHTSHYRRSEALPSTQNESVQQHLSQQIQHQGAQRPPLQAKQKSIYQDESVGVTTPVTSQMSASRRKRPPNLNQYGNGMGPEGVPAYDVIPGSSQSKRKFINNEANGSFYQEPTSASRTAYKPSSSHDRSRQLSGQRRLYSTDGTPQENKEAKTLDFTAQDINSMASPLRQDQPQNEPAQAGAQIKGKGAAAARANISNLPQSKLDQVRGQKGERTREQETEDLFNDLTAMNREREGPAIRNAPSTNQRGPAAVAGRVGRNGARTTANRRQPATNFFAAWDEAEAMDLDFTTQEVLADNEAFDMLAERGYETLMEYPDGGKDPKAKLQEYELQQQNNNYVFNFENYLRRQQEEERLEQIKLAQEARESGSDNDGESGSYYDEEEDDEAEPAGRSSPSRVDKQAEKSDQDGDGKSDEVGSDAQSDGEKHVDKPSEAPRIEPEEVKQKVGRPRRKNQRPRKGEPGYGVFAINTSYCRSELELLQHVIYKNQLRETSIGGDLYWMALALNKQDFKRVAKNKFYWNRYPCLEYLARKKVFCLITNRMRKTFEKQFGFSPISFQLPEETHSLQSYMQEHPKFTFICKPNSGKGGEGIFLIDKFKDIPKNLWSDSHADLLVQRYIKTPILLDKKKFDLRIYVLIKGFDPIEAYLCDEGLARFCTEDYRQPNPQNMKNMFMHLTNFTLNKQSENYKAPENDFLQDGGDTGSKRLLSSLWKTLEEEGHDVSEIQDKIKDTVKKAIITFEPYLTQYYRTNISKVNTKNSKVFQILGLDILIDKKMNAWLMEVNSNPSLNIFLEREIPGALDGQTEKVLQELDKHVKAKVVHQTIKIVTGEGNDDYDGSFEQLLPDPEMSEYYIWNRAQKLYEMITNTSQTKKDPDMRDRISMFQFARLHKVPEFGKLGSYFKADLELVFKNMIIKYDLRNNHIDLYGFFEAIEILASKIYKDETDNTPGDNLGLFIDAATVFFEEFLQKQQDEADKQNRTEPGFAAKRKIPEK